jgi:hypothetical protein
MTEFISRKYGNDGYEVTIKTDSHEHYKAAEDFARELIDHKKPMTNHDRIRAMSDEELKDSILAVSLGYSQWCDYHCENKGDDGCDKCIKKWL